MTRLYKHQIKRRVAREERFSGSHRRIVNQHRTGIVSRFTLGIYQRGDMSPYGRKSSMCNEDYLLTINNNNLLYLDIARIWL
jgi:uncharacterized protein (DUF1015 family)